MPRHVKEYCRHCLCEQWGTWKGPRLYCDARDHLMRNKGQIPDQPPAQGPSPYEEMKQLINRKYHGKSAYTWDELQDWCTDRKWFDLASFCKDMEQVELDLSL
jgi:hypothetical protein